MTTDCDCLLRLFWETVYIRSGCWGMHWELVGNSYELLGNRWYSSGPLENLWGLLVKNSFVGRGPNTNRAHPHACNIPYKTALPVPCTHRFWQARPSEMRFSCTRNAHFDKVTFFVPEVVFNENGAQKASKLEPKSY